MSFSLYIKVGARTPSQILSSFRMITNSIWARFLGFRRNIF